MAQTARMASFQSGRRQLDGYIAYPEGDGPFPGIILIHEIFGLNGNMKDISRRFAAQGYVALAVNLFAGRDRAICMFRVMSGLLLNPLNNRGIHDLKAALTFLSEQPGVDASRLGAVGYCFGGSFVIAWACTDDRLQVIAPYYALNPRPLPASVRWWDHTPTRILRPRQHKSWMLSWIVTRCHTILKSIPVRSMDSSMIPRKFMMNRRHRIHGGVFWHFLRSISWQRPKDSIHPRTHLDHP